VKTRLPTQQEIEELVAFLPRLYAEGFTPITGWGGGTTGEDGVLTMPWPEYNETVLEFIRSASRCCWCDYQYHPGHAGKMLMDEEAVKHALIPQIKSMITYCVRGERFSDGHWGAMIDQGYIHRLLERLRELL